MLLLMQKGCIWSTEGIGSRAKCSYKSVVKYWLQFAEDFTKYIITVFLEKVLKIFSKWSIFKTNTVFFSLFFFLPLLSPPLTPIPPPICLLSCKSLNSCYHVKWTDGFDLVTDKSKKDSNGNIVKGHFLL